MRHTFFAHFVAGESVSDTYGMLERVYDTSRCGAMLNWSAEAEENQEHSYGDDLVPTGEPLLLEEAVGELQRAIDAAARFKPDMPVKPTTIAIKGKSHAL